MTAPVAAADTNSGPGFELSGAAAGITAPVPSVGITTGGMTVGAVGGLAIGDGADADVGIETDDAGEAVG